MTHAIDFLSSAGIDLDVIAERFHLTVSGLCRRAAAGQLTTSQLQLLADVTDVAARAQAVLQLTDVGWWMHMPNQNFGWRSPLDACEIGLASLVLQFLDDLCSVIPDTVAA